MMMQKQKISPPKHRHDGTSPLPLGMDWSPPPKKWDGRATVWPHDSQSGWSYCVTIPSWITLPKSRDAEGIVFYRVQVGIQSPDGVSTARGVLRRFSDFMKLFSDLKRAFPKKNLPPAPSKHILRINSSRSLPEGRRSSLEEWMQRLLSDIDLSRSVPVASFLELEAAARSSFQDISQQSSAGTSSPAPGYGSDSAYEASELGTPRQVREYSSEIGTEDLDLDQDLASPIETLTFSMSSDDNGFFTGRNMLEKLEGFPRHKLNASKESGLVKDASDVSKLGSFSGDRMDCLSEPEYGRLASHSRKHSTESVGSDISSIRGSEISNTGIASSLGDGFLEFGGSAEASTTEMESPNTQIVLPLDQRQKMNRVLLTMQRRLGTARTDMEDLIARLNQEIAVKNYLTTKIKDLEVELETSKQKSKENLQQAILVERERFTQMQWDMEELRRKSLEMEMKLKSEQDEKVRTESTKTSAVLENESLVQELDSTKQKLVNLQKNHEELLLKSKADTKVLIREVKSLRNSQIELKQELSQSLTEKSELEKVLQKEKRRTEHAINSKQKLLHECGVLRDRLQECSVNLFEEEKDRITVDTSLSDALDLLATSDNRIGLLLAEAQLLAQVDGDDETSVVYASNGQGVNNGENLGIMDYEIRKMLTDIFIDNARLRKQVNGVVRCALKTTLKPEKDEDSEKEEE
ncbi:hypothetical protein MKW98_024330 [Papaver atlanticum]|uniref:PX domain-containing protein n=1 Tax=Papaver atlanticum TaxID=357466 RepID=A0AAD4XN56_9MAGN|nr:hypothetical protein MKW98_024330 [Papaver atlanticum]